MRIEAHVLIRGSEQQLADFTARCLRGDDGAQRLACATLMPPPPGTWDDAQHACFKTFTWGSNVEPLVNVKRVRNGLGLIFELLIPTLSLFNALAGSVPGIEVSATFEDLDSGRLNGDYTAGRLTIASGPYADFDAPSLLEEVLEKAGVS